LDRHAGLHPIPFVNLCNKLREARSRIQLGYVQRMST
jgi:hypothetical protein